MRQQGRSKRDLPTGVQCVRREVSLPPYYDRLVEQRAQSRGIGRSEAFRQIVEEAQGRQPRALLQEIREQTALIMIEIAGVKLITKNPDLLEWMTRAKAAGDRIQKILSDLATV